MHALKGLVKLQALVRGHLVRKQTTATLRGMHALMSIQVRARIKRIKMAEEVNPLEIQPPQRTEIPSFKGQMIQQNQVSLCRNFANICTKKIMQYNQHSFWMSIHPIENSF